MPPIANGNKVKGGLCFVKSTRRLIGKMKKPEHKTCHGCGLENIDECIASKGKKPVPVLAMFFLFPKKPRANNKFCSTERLVMFGLDGGCDET